MSYLWEKEIKSIEGRLVTLVDDKQVKLTERQLTYMITETPIDLTAQRDLLISEIVPDMVKLLEEHDIMKWDLTHILNILTSTFNENYLKAVSKAMGTYDETLSNFECEKNVRISHIFAKLSS